MIGVRIRTAVRWSLISFLLGVAAGPRVQDAVFAILRHYGVPVP